MPLLRFSKATSVLKPHRQSSCGRGAKPFRPTKAAEMRETAEAKEMSE
jgi:hypothetical protein